MSEQIPIAVVDDDEPFRAALVEVLDAEGYDVRGFASAEDFLAAKGEMSCRCVITDIQMPGMSGLDLKRLLAARNSTIPVIMITGLSEPGLAAEAAGLGVAGLLRKPFAPAALLACLESALKG